MDPISVIVSALVLGIAAGLKSTAETETQKAYEGLKKLIQDKYKVHLGALEKKPDSETQQEAIKEQLEDTNVSDDDDAIEGANAVVEAFEKEQPDIPSTIGVHLKDVKAGIVRFKNLRAHDGTAAYIEGGEFKELNFEDVETGEDRKNN